MLKRKIDRRLRDFFKTSRNALLISGARQIGKTFSIREYGKEYKHFVEINFVDNPEAAEMFGKGLSAHGFNSYYNNKKRGELDFVVEMQGGVLPIEVRSGKDYAQHRALNNVLACAYYDIPYALVLNNDNLRVDGRVVYAPIYMTMFLEHDNDAPEFYKIDLTGLG